MSFKADIPTLSANEVYTLTFEYEGTETIQLVVGDLTLETTDRRVVFTTTSPVNYIESNVNLTNLNMYEGYYESDDFGGEYTQESYIEGMSLINLINVTDSDFPKQTSWYDFTINKNISDGKYYTLIFGQDMSELLDYSVRSLHFRMMRWPFLSVSFPYHVRHVGEQYVEVGVIDFFGKAMFMV